VSTSLTYTRDFPCLVFCLCGEVLWGAGEAQNPSLQVYFTPNPNPNPKPNPNLTLTLT